MGMSQLRLLCRQSTSTTWRHAVALTTLNICATLWLSGISAAETDGPAASPSPAAERPVVEVFCERYSDGKAKVEREVTTDADGNYVNHGRWRTWDRAGKLVAEGSYDMGQRSGAW